MSGYKTLKQINENPIYAPIGCEEEFKRRIFLDNFERCMNIRTFQKTAGIIIKKKITGIHPVAKIMKEPIENYRKNHSCRSIANRLDIYPSFYSYYKYGRIDHLLIFVCRSDRYVKDLYGIDKTILAGRWGGKTREYATTKLNRFHQVRELWHKVTNIERAYRTNFDWETEIIDGFLRIGYVKFIQLFTHWIINVRVKDLDKGLKFAEMYSTHPLIIGSDNDEELSYNEILNLAKNRNLNFLKLYPLKNL